MQAFLYESIFLMNSRGEKRISRVYELFKRKAKEL